MNKTVVITGSNSGFGRLSVETLAKNGYTVFATMRGVETKNKEAAENLSAWAIKNNYKLQVVDLDVTNDESVIQAVKTIMSNTDKIDVVINNAGLFAGGLNEGFSAQDFKNIYDVNVFGVLRVNNAFLPFMRKQGNGLLIHISSGMARFVMPFTSPYTSSKWALDALAEGYHYELAPLGIDSVIIEPGAFPTDMSSKAYNPSNAQVFEEYGDTLVILNKFMEGFSQMFKGPNIPNPQEVADAVLKLIETPLGSRPIRTVVDSMSGQAIEAINNSSGQVQTNILKHFGF